MNANLGLRVAVVVVVLFPTGCKKPDSTKIIAAPGGDLYYRIEEFSGKEAVMAPSSLGVYAVLNTPSGHDEKLVFSGTYVDIKYLVWESDTQGMLCLSGGYTETYRRIVPLIVGSRTQAVYTHLSDKC